MSVEPLTSLQDTLGKKELGGWLQPVADEFHGEYPASYARRLEHLCGFTGSAGMGMFFSDPQQTNLLFTDGRYTIQAQAETDANTIAVQEPNQTLAAWLSNATKDQLSIGFHGWSHAYAEVMQWKGAAPNGVSFQAHHRNIIDDIWQEQPELPSGPIALHPENVAGVGAKEKIDHLAQALRKHGANAIFLTLPDDICWLLNIRGADTDYNPLVLAYLKISQSGKGCLYLASRVLDASVQSYFDQLGIHIASLEALWQSPESAFEAGETIWLTPETTPHALYQAALETKLSIVTAPNPVQQAKAIKNDVELQEIQKAHRIDGAALSGFLCELNRGEIIDELQVEERLQHFRNKSDDYRGPSFSTIAGSGPNGAIVHYRATEKTNREWRENEILLIDSGGQYTGGTTDVTRTLIKGTPTAEMKDRYTRVLKGHIAIARTQFPKGTSGAQLDALARQYLWETGCDYDHGTGHGVGAYLCVHEGPQSISKRANQVALQSGMILSNEPGYYKQDAYGIRIENLVEVVSRGISADDREMLGFETLTLAPIETALIEISLLTKSEIEWLNAYHQHVLNELSDMVDDTTKSWLKNVCKPL